LVEVLGNLAWVMVGLVAAAILSWKVLRYLQLAAMKSGKTITGR